MRVFETIYTTNCSGSCDYDFDVVPIDFCRLNECLLEKCCKAALI